jgi:hypothetical protein
LYDADARLLARAEFAAFCVSADGGRTDLTGRESEALDRAFQRLGGALTEALGDRLLWLRDATADGGGFSIAGCGTSRRARSRRGGGIS